MDQQYVWRRNNEAYTENILPTVKYGSGSMVHFGCFAFSGIQNLQHLKDKMDSIKYHEVFRKKYVIWEEPEPWVSLVFPSGQTVKVHKGLVS